MSERKYISRIGWVYTIYIIVIMGLQFGIGGLIVAFREYLPVWIYNENALLLLSQVIMYVLAFPVFKVLMEGIPPCHMAEPKTIGFKQFMILLIVCFGTVYIGNLAGTGLMKLVEIVTGVKNTNPLDAVLGNMNLLAVGLSTVIIAPIMEELMFRKYLVDRLVPFGQKTAVVLSGITFGIFHGNFYQFFYAALLGMIFAYIYSSTGKIRYTILLHMCINFVGGVLALVLAQGVDSGNALAYAFSSIWGIASIASIIAAVVLFFAYFRRLPWFSGWIRPERGIVRTVIGAPGTWGFLAAGIVLFLLN